MSNAEAITAFAASSELLDDWQELPFERCVHESGVKRIASVPQGNYKPEGRFPVVDQGSGLIAGYTDDGTLVHDGDLPIILFGDHTRIFKFLEFPFATGADGTKLFRANEGTVDPKFLYYALLHLDIPSRGYNRHFKYLKEKIICAPKGRDEQRAIAAVLSKIQKAAEVQEKIVATLKELKAATMAKLFREGLRGETLKQTEIGELPESWEVVRMGSICDKINYGTSVRCSSEKSGRPVLRIPNIINETVDMSALKWATLPDHEVCKLLLEQDDLVFVRTNGNKQYTGRCAVYQGQPEGALFASYLIRIRLSKESILPTFAQAYLSSVGREQITSKAHPASDGKYNIDTGVLKEVLLPRPSTMEQKAIIEIIVTVNRRLEAAREEAQRLKSVFSSMLHLLMTGQVRVTQKMIALHALEDRKKKQKKYSGKVDEKRLQEIVRRIVEAVQPEKIILFGSAVRGEMGPDSDVDLLVIKACTNKRKTWEIIEKKLGGIGVPKDIVVATPEDVEYCKDIPGYIIRYALREGKVVYPS